MNGISRRDFMKKAGMAALGLSLVEFSGLAAGCGGAKAADGKTTAAAKPVETTPTSAEKAKVYFTDKIDAEHLIRLYQKVNAEIQGKVAVKLPTGKPHGPNILPRDMVKAFQAAIPNSVIVETNTMYVGDRDTTEKHRKTLEINGWTFCPVDIMDEEGTVMLPVRNYLHLPEVSMGSHLLNYDSMVVLTHFKGHARGGFGGSLKNIAIGCADGQIGKRMVHGFHKSDAPGVDDWEGSMANGALFMENMADSGKATCDFFGKRIVFINVLRRMSVDCDCAGVKAAEPVIPDLGILASTDILAVDQASCDMVYARPEKEKHDLVERIESRDGLAQLAAMRKLGMGNPRYEIVPID